MERRPPAGTARRRRAAGRTSGMAPLPAWPAVAQVTRDSGNRASLPERERGGGLDSLPFCKREERRVGPHFVDSGITRGTADPGGRGVCRRRGELRLGGTGGLGLERAGPMAITKQRSPCVPRGGKALRALLRFAAALRVPGRIARAVGGGVMAGSSDPASSSVSPSGGRLRVAFAVRCDRAGSAIRQLDRRPARELGVVHRMGSTSEVMRRRFSSGCVRGRRGSCRAAWRRRSAGFGPRGFSGCGRGCVRGP